MSRNPLPQGAPVRARLPLAVGVVVPVVFVVVLLIEGLTRPGYNSWRDMGSSLSTGPGGWMQIVNFIACDLLIMVAAAALARRHPPTAWGPRLITIFGLSLVIAGAFTTDPANGYPPGTPVAGGPQTWHGTIHDLNAFLAFGSITAAAFVFGRAFARDPHTRAWARYSYLTATASLLLFAASLTAAALGQNHAWHGAPGGFLQRLAIIVAWGWLSLLSLRALRSRAGHR
jgi:Protein of unknown function (DUF998)